MIPYILKLISSAYNHLKTVSDETMSDTSESGYGNSRKNVYIDKCLRPEWIFVGSEVHFGGVGRTLCKLDKTCTSDPFQSLKLISRFTYRMYSSLQILRLVNILQNKTDLSTLLVLLTELQVNKIRTLSEDVRPAPQLSF